MQFWLAFTQVEFKGLQAFATTSCSWGSFCLLVSIGIVCGEGHIPFCFHRENFCSCYKYAVAIRMLLVNHRYGKI